MKQCSAIIKLVILLAAIYPHTNFAQSCGTCTVTISSSSGTLSSAAYTVGNGQTFCIDSTGKFTGTITLNGGTICNKGSFKPTVFNYNSGTLTNYGSAAISSSLSLSSSKTLNCEKKSLLRINGNLVFTGGTMTNKGIANIKDNVTHSSGTLNNSGIVNCKTFSVSVNSYTNTGIINKD
jgi:phage baseplate assembly protein gpV